MPNREFCPLLEAAEALQEYSLSNQQRIKAKQEKQLRERLCLEERIYGAKDAREERQKSYTTFSENLKTNLLTEAIRSIYLGAMSERIILEDNHLVIADNLIHGYIMEHGGADAVLRSFKEKTYLLDRIRCIVEAEHEEIMDDVDKENPDTQEVPEEKSGEMYDALEKEEDVHSAIDIIAQRISTAEEEFIRQNAEDKKKMEELANKVNERLQAVKDDRDLEDSEKEEIEKECAIDFSRQKAAIQNDRRHTVLEQMTINLYGSIVTDESLREEFVQESGRIDTQSVIESALCMYGFLETINTLKMDTVDAAYIQNIIRNMK